MRARDCMTAGRAAKIDRFEGLSMKREERESFFPMAAMFVPPLLSLGFLSSKEVGLWAPKWKNKISKQLLGLRRFPFREIYVVRLFSTTKAAERSGSESSWRTAWGVPKLCSATAEHHIPATCQYPPVTFLCRHRQYYTREHTDIQAHSLVSSLMAQPLESSRRIQRPHRILLQPGSANSLYGPCYYKQHQLVKPCLQRD